jgi:hypothetical protein
LLPHSRAGEVALVVAVFSRSPNTSILIDW